MRDREGKKEQVEAIKKRLSAAIEESGLSDYQLTEKINDSEDPLTVNYNTVKSTLNLQNTALDMTTVIAISRYLHLDTAVLLSPPGTDESSLHNMQNSGITGKFVPLMDTHYHGTFYGYLPTRNTKRSDIIPFELEIIPTYNSVRATMTYHGFTEDVNNNIESAPISLYGTPILDTTRSNIFITFTNDQGHFFFLYFSRQHFHSGLLYFRKGVVLTASNLGDNPPLLENFVLFAKQLSDEKKKYIPGLLQIMSPSFAIKKTALEQLAKNNSIVRNFMDSFGYIVEHHQAPVYIINEEQIIKSITEETIDRDQTYAALMLINEHAISTNRITYKDNNDLSGFAKTFLQR